MKYEQMIRFIGVDPAQVTASVNEWLKENAGKVIIKQRILDESKQQIIIFYEEKPKTRIKIKAFTAEKSVADWLEKMQTEAETKGTYFQVVKSSTVLMHDSVMTPYSLRDIYYEVEEN